MKKLIALQAGLVAALIGQLCQAEGKNDSEMNVNPLREAYYGDLHLHTGNSFDAYIFGTLTTPDTAYRFARGEEVTHQGKAIKRAWPLDFLAVADHSEWLGISTAAQNSDGTLYGSEIGTRIRARDKKLFNEYADSLFKSSSPPGSVDTKAITHSAWEQTIEAANRHYRPGKFTTFVGYEWTATPNYENLHRIVIFRGSKAPDPFTSWDSARPEDLWTYLEDARKAGNDAIAMPHNANASSGRMYALNDSAGRPIDRIYAQRRVLNEPLSEIAQQKGQSDTHPLLSPNDEFADFELMDYLAGGVPNQKREVHGSYVREAYGRGLLIAHKLGVNPYKFGVQASSDLHDGLSKSSEESGSSGLAGVWAEQNTRESIFDAFRRKETFGTTGTRLKFRFFGGWNYPKTLFRDAHWLKTAYAEGVPMGADLPRGPAGSQAPTFVVWAVKDPNGANLDRAQIIKLWLEGEGYREKVFDVAWSSGRVPDVNTGKLSPVGNTVEVNTASYKNTIGATELRAVWKDPEFNPKQAALYYLRVLEIPTPRWTTVRAARGEEPLPSKTPATIQERGWSSPIWFAPGKPGKGGYGDE